MKEKYIPLYIDGTHCTSLEQLRSYFSETIKYDSSVFRDLLDYARGGEIAAWLRHKGESGLASTVEKIDTSLGDSDYIARLASLVKSDFKHQINTIIEKPNFSDVFLIENITSEKSSGNNIAICVHLKVLSSINENYILELYTIAGSDIGEINPYNSKVGDTIVLKFNFPDIVSCVTILVDGEELVRNKTISTKNHSSSITDVTYDKSSNILKVGDTIYKMQKVIGDCFEMGSDCASSFEKPCHEKSVDSFLIMDSVVTQELWEAVMGTNPSKFKGSKRPVTNVSYYDCIIFIKELNAYLNENFRLPKEAEWEYAARGGNTSKITDYAYAGSDCIGDVAWYFDNSKCVTHDVRHMSFQTICTNNC